MNIEELLNDKNKLSFELNVGKTYVTLIELLTLNNAYLQSILKRQIEIQELIKGKSGQELEDDVTKKVSFLSESIFEVAEENRILHITSIIKG